MKRRTAGGSAAEPLIIIFVTWLLTVFILRKLDHSELALAAASGISAIVVFAWAAPMKAQAVAKWCFRYRWGLALLVFCLCVFFRLHGSSIGRYDEILPTQIEAEETTLFGVPRWIRFDEFCVQTPTFFSQSYNRHKLYSTQMSISETNMVLDYYSPVKDLTAIGKPLSWGYLLFGNEIGLSWYWCGIEILLFMTALEMCLILTQRAKRISFLGAMMIALSPEIQWWVLPHMPIVILYSMGIFCVAYSFFTAKTAFFKWLFSLLSIVAVTGFVLSIFPSFQVPCAYIVLVLLVTCLWRDREKITFARREWARLAIPTVLAGGILIYFFLISRNDLALLLNTVYPGRRVSTGGTWPISALFTDISSLLLPYKDVIYSNNSEVSTYIQFAPFFLALMPKFFLCLKKKERSNLAVGVALTIILITEIVFMLVGFPTYLAEITLLRFCNRMDSVYGWTAALFTIWGFSVFWKYPDILNRREKIIYTLLYGLVCWLLVNEEMQAYFYQFEIHGFQNTGLVLMIGAVAGLSLTLFLVEGRRERLLTAAIVLMMFFSGATVNPLERGAGAIYNHPISKAVSAIESEKPESRWLCVDCTSQLSNFLMANGAKVLSATNFYPDLGKWKIIDPNSQYKDVYNRYANQTSTIITEESSVELTQTDGLKMNINPEILKELEIQYLLCKNDYSEILDRYGIGCEYITGQDGYDIYRLHYEFPLL